ncbi:MAG: LysR family transcriptional regulator [Coriobacteriales bacterium]|nr:LysR family transcriptional regulator [Coriobacteriales bacterium]
MFERNAISTRLTYAGESFIPYAREIVTADDRANAWITEYKKAKPLHLVIELFAGFKVTDDLASLIKLKLSEKYPSAVLEIKDIREGDPLEDLRNNDCDLVFAAIPENADVAGLMNVPVNTEQLAAIVNKMNPLAAQDAITI